MSEIKKEKSHETLIKFIKRFLLILLHIYIPLSLYLYLLMIKKQIIKTLFTQ